MEPIPTAYISAHLASGRVTPQFIALLDFEMAWVEAHYRDARVGVRRLDTGRVGMMAGLEVYRAILPGIWGNGYDIFTRPRRHHQAAEARACAARAVRGLLRLTQWCKYHGQKFFGVFRNRHHSPSDS
jgi:phytoene/squalene synthetase